MFLDERVHARLAAATRFADIRHLPEVDSTNRYVRDAASSGAPEGLVAVADHQTAGRGRLGRSWQAPPRAGLLVSLLLRPEGLAPTRLHLITAAVGLAAREALGSAAGVVADLKWPNDLLVADRKLGGILAESSGGAVIAGMGINLTWAPPGAVSAAEVAGRPVDRGELLVAFLETLERRYGRWEEVAEDYRDACATVGRRVRVESPAGDLEGWATEVDHDGRLVVRPDDGPEVTVAAGDVIHIRPATGGGW